MKTKKGTQFFHALGGRKQFNGYIATLLLTAMAPLLGASFPEYSFGLLGALGVTSGLIFMEDEAEKKYSKDGRNLFSANPAPDAIAQSELPASVATEIDRSETALNNLQPLDEGEQPVRQIRSMNELNLQAAGKPNSR